ncbi:MAG TPA: hypothetical protein VF812_06965 [Ktedonobacterales bacterium]
MDANDTPDSTPRPTARDAARAVRAYLGLDAVRIERFPTGLCHYVYDVTTADGRQVVARLATEETRDQLAGGVYWHARLRGVGAPLPALYAAHLDPAEGFPVMLLERLPGQDLGLVYERMSRDQWLALAARIVELQRAVATLPHASGFGYALSYEDERLHASWLDVVLAEVERSRQRILAAGVVAPDWAEHTRARVLEQRDYLLSVAPIAFLDDTTTKNVLIHEGALSGVVDTDVVCFGDPLFTLALTRVALLAHQLDPDYADHWRELLRLDDARQAALALYTAVFCLTFLGEIGQRFNRDEPVSVDRAYQRRLEATLNGLLNGKE